MANRHERRPNKRLHSASSRCLALCVAAAWAGVLLPWPAQAQVLELAGGRTSIQPSLSLDQVFTDNYRLSASDKASDSITRATAGVKVQGRSARVQGFLDYSLSGSVYANHSVQNASQQALTSSLNAELIERRLTLEAGATISRRAISAFGASAANAELVNANAAEVRSYRVAPTLRGLLPGGLVYSATAGWTASDAANGGVGNASTGTAAFHLAPGSAGRWAWAVDAQHTASGFSLGRNTDSDRLFGTLSADLNAIDLRLSANAGRELSNLATPQREGHGTWGLGAQWAPSAVTQASAKYDSRAFGHTNQLAFTHRTPLTVWQASSSRSLNYGTASVGQRGTAFELFYAQLASVEPDPIKRVDRVLQLLQRSGLDPNARDDAGFLSGSATLVDQQQLSAAWHGLRDTAVLTIQRSVSRRADPIAAVADDLANASQLRTQSLTLNLSHNLTPVSNLVLVTTWQQSDGSLANQHSVQRLVNLLWSQTLSPYINVSAGLRRGLYDVRPAAYSEAAITALIAARF